MTWTQFVQSLRKGLAERARRTSMASQSTPQRAAAVRAIAIESHQPQAAIQSASRCQPMEEWSYYLIDVSYRTLSGLLILMAIPLSTLYR